jgi:hypothetical protein
MDRYRGPMQRPRTMTSRVEQQIMAETAEVLGSQGVALHLVRVEGEMKTMRVTSEGLAASVNQLTHEVRQLNTAANRAEATDASVKRLWTEIAARDEKWDRRLESMGKDHRSTRDTVNKIQWMIAGGGLVFTALLGLLTWLGNRELTKADDSVREARAVNQKLDERLDRVEIHLAGDHERPYSR